ncbi:MFS transporter [Rugosimonospora acidiphila]|uniref:MFS transporter n=1 Tax=Rugosimonospora acidiphila TaxID=556531 RepID=A0ABP9SIF3_9ACTN
MNPPRSARLPPRAAFWAGSAALFVTLMSANLPTPLYQVYKQRFGFSNSVLTLIYATYALVLIPSLLAFGQLSDRVGRRRVIAMGLGAAAVGDGLFAAAQGTGWLFAARGVQGLAVGVITGTATAALVELEPRGDRRRAALGAVLGQASGGALGPLLGGVLDQWAPLPRTLSFLVGVLAAVAAGLLVLRIPEPHPPTGKWRPQIPSVPAEHRAEFFRAGLTAALVWAVGALFLSVVPAYAGTLLKTKNLAVLGGISAVALAATCAAQWFSLRMRVHPDTGQLAGLLTMVAGLVVLVAANPLASPPALVVAAVLAGLGLGMSFVGAQTQINRLAPGQRRGEVTAAFITMVYLGVSVSAIGVGVLSDVLSRFAGITIVSAVIVAGAIPTALWHARVGPLAARFHRGVR